MVTQVFMHDRVVSDITEELGLNRSTAKSWVSLIPRRLANDSYFRSFLGKCGKNG